MDSEMHPRLSPRVSDPTVRRTRFRRGGVLITTLAFSVVIAMLLAGMASISVSHYGRALAESDYAAALDLAEAGVNFEFRKISTNPATVDQRTNGNGITYSLGSATFTVYCTNKDGSTPWAAPNPLYVVSVGTRNGVSRTVRVSAKGYGATDNYAVYAIKTGLWSSKGHITGNLGTNGTLTASDQVAVNGKMLLNGGGASSSGGFTATTVVHAPAPVVWPYVHDIAAAKFPGGGLSWLATPGNNDNPLCSAIHNNQILVGGGNITFPSKVGGANYALTKFIMSGAGNIIIDNTLGPVTIWLGPDGGQGSVSGNPNFDFQSTVNMNYVSANPANHCIIYDSTSGPFTLESDGTMNVGIYAYNIDGRDMPSAA